MMIARSSKGSLCTSGQTKNTRMYSRIPISQRYIQNHLSMAEYQTGGRGRFTGPKVAQTVGL